MSVYSILSEVQLAQACDRQPLSLFNACDPKKRTLILIWPQFGDFDTIEYAWWIAQGQSKLTAANIQTRAVGIGDFAAAQKFSTYTGFCTQHLYIAPTASVHKALGLYQGLGAAVPGMTPQQKGYLNLLLMCAGIGSPGTLKEVFRGYRGDKSAPQLIADDEVVKAAPLPALTGETFKAAGGKGFQRPFELATLRLRNMVEVLGNWKTYVPDAAYLTQRGATFLFEPDGRLVYEWRDRNILGFAENMSNPLSFLDKLSEK